jgi:hypothetical protein
MISTSDTTTSKSWKMKMIKIRIDGWLYFLPSSTQRISTLQRDLYRIIHAIAVAGGDVRSHDLMRFVGLQRFEPYEFRVKRLVEMGYLQPEHQAKSKLEALVA